MADQMLYHFGDIDTIRPRTDKDRALLALAERHGIYTRLERAGPDAYGFNRVKFGELRAFAAELLWHAKPAPALGVSASDADTNAHQTPTKD